MKSSLVIHIAFFCSYLEFAGCSPKRPTKETKEKHLENNQDDLIQLCGFRYENNEQETPFNRIVGGAAASKDEFKWQISIKLKRGSETHHMCGGAVIGKSWVVTAAHCTVDFSVDELIYVAGDYKMFQREGDEQTRKAALVIQHENYDPISQENDISLIKTEKPFDFRTLHVAPACLPDPFEEFTGSCVVTGWGKRKEGGTNTNVLQKVWLPLISDSSCIQSMKKIGYDGLIRKPMLCAGVTAGGKDACQGDSGGPLVCPGKGNLPVLTGIVSWGIGCARKNVPGVYTEVSHYVKWISSKVELVSRLKSDQEVLSLGYFSSGNKNLRFSEHPHDVVNETAHFEGGRVRDTPPTKHGNEIQPFAHEISPNERIHENQQTNLNPPEFHHNGGWGHEIRVVYEIRPSKQRHVLGYENERISGAWASSEEGGSSEEDGDR